MNIRKISIYLFIFSLFFLLSFFNVCVTVASEYAVTDEATFKIAAVSDDPALCNMKNTIWGKAYCACEINFDPKPVGEGPVYKISRNRCQTEEVTIQQPALLVGALGEILLKVDLNNNICSAEEGALSEHIFTASCKIKQLKAPDACLCSQDSSKLIGIVRPDRNLLINKSGRILAKNVELDSLSNFVRSGTGIDSSSPGSKVSEPILSKILEYPNFKTGETCVPFDPTDPLEDRLWDCSKPVFFDKTVQNVCCCEGINCTKKPVFTIGLQVCGDKEKQVPLSTLGDCNIGPQDVGKITGMDLGALQQRAKTELNPLNFESLNNLIGRFTKANMMNVGAVAMAMYIWAGFLWMTASGNSERTTKAKTIMVWTTLGVVVILASYMLVSFVFSNILQL